MTIRSRLYFGALVSIGSAGVLALMLFYFSSQMSAESQKQDVANKLARQMTDLIIVTEEYLAFRYPRCRQQWQATYDHISELLDQNPLLLSTVRQHVEEQHRIFSRIVSIFDKQSVSEYVQTEMELKEKHFILEERLSAHIRLISREIIASAYRISHEAHSRLSEITRRSTVLILSYIFMMISAVLLTAYLTVKSITRPLNELIQGAACIEQGDFAYLFNSADKKSTIRPGDEMGNLAAAFDSMTHRLVGSLEKLELEIQERCRAENARHQSESRYKTLFKNMVQGVFYQQADGTLTDCNQALLDLFGLTRDQFLGKTSMDPAWKVIHEDGSDFPGEAHPSMAALKTGKPVKDVAAGVFNPVKKDYVWLNINAIPQFKPDEIKPYQVIVTLHDITGIKQAEKEKERLEQQFLQAQKLDSIGRLAGGVAHDLNNLLSPILGYGEMLLEDIYSDGPQKEALEEMVKAGMRARNLVRQLLAFSRKQALEFRTVDLNLLLRNFENLLRRTIREDIEINLLLKKSLPYIKGDTGQLEQVIMNLAVNAQDAMPDGGTLSIETGEAELDQEYAAKHQGAAPGFYVMLIFTDTGIGIDAETLKYLFEPFFTTKKMKKGTGLGLATVYGIVKQHRGNIWVYSEPGQGATFKIYLPVSIDSDADNIDDSPALPAPERTGTEIILLAEDNEQVRKMALSILKRDGYTVFAAADGKEALHIAENHDGPIDLLLTDVVMPEMNGRQLSEQILLLHPNIKVIYMSGYTDNVIARRGMMDPDIHFIQKPFSIKALAGKIRAVLDE